MQDSILQTLHYFSRFRYPPTIEDLHRYLAVAATDFELKRELSSLVANGHITIDLNRVFVNGYDYTGYFERYQHSTTLLQAARSYISILEYLPTIELIGISGSLSMANAGQEDDIDIFIIASTDTIWITRFIVLLYKKILSLIKPSIGKNLCFNLFFSENGLKLQNEKQTLYVAHEILQLKVIYNKKGIYHRFLNENSWIWNVFPNIRMKFESEIIEKTLTRNHQFVAFFDKMLSYLQKWWLKTKGFSYTEQNGQLWLIQRDWNAEIASDLV